MVLLILFLYGLSSHSMHIHSINLCMVYFYLYNGSHETMPSLASVKKLVANANDLNISRIGTSVPKLRDCSSVQFFSTS